MKMTKKIISLLLCVAMLFGLTIPAFAEGETVSVVYHYKDAATRADVTRDGIVTDLEAGSKYAIEFVAPFTQEEYFVGWYATPDFSGEQIDKEITLADGVNNIYAKYEAYKTKVNAIIPNASYYKDKENTYIYYPTMANKYGYSKWVEGSKTWHGGITYNAETNTTTFVSDGSNAPALTILSDANRNFIAARPATTYLVSFEVKVQEGTTDRFIRPGVGVLNETDNTEFKNQWGDIAFTKNGDPAIFGEYLKIPAAGTGEEFVKYTLSITTPALAEYPSTHNFMTLGFRATAAGNTVEFRNITVEEVSAEYYVGETLVNKEYPAKGGAATLAAPDASYIPEGKSFAGWYLDKELTQAANAVTVNGNVKLYAKVGEPPKAQYVVNGETVLEETIALGQPYAPKSFIPNAEDIPEGYYFTGWYSDEECTQLVAEADLTKEITVNGEFTRYAGLRKYEDAFNPVLAEKKMSMPFVFDGGEEAEDYYAPYLYGYSYQRFNIEEDYYKNVTGGSGISFFLDENGVAYQADANAVYTITFDYKYTNLNDSSKSIVVGIGYKGFSAEKLKDTENIKKTRGFAIIDSAHNDSYWSAFKKISLAANTETETEWATATLTLSLGEDLTGVVPVFAIGNGYMTNVTYKIKNLKVQKQVAKVNVHVGETVTTTELVPGSTFVPEIIPEAPEGMFFKGWFLDESFTQAMPAEGVVVNEETNIYAKFGAPLSIVYNYLNADGTAATKVVKENLDIGSTYALKFVAPNTADKYFVDWYLTEDFSGEPIDSTITIASDEQCNVYAKYVEYATSMNLHIAGSGSTATNVHLPTVTDPTYGAKLANYYRITRASTTWITSSTYDAETNTTRFIANDNSATTSHVLVDANNSFVAAKPGATYKVTFKAVSETGSAKVQLGVGVPAAKFTRTTWGTTDWYDGYHDMVYKSDAVEITATEDFAEYTAMVTVPEEIGEDVVNFIGLRFVNVGEIKYIDVKDIVVEEYIPEPITVVYNYKNADGTAAQKVVDEELELGSKYYIDFLAPNTDTQYFVDWYLTEDFSGEPVNARTITIANDGVNNLYAKYVDYSNVMNLIVPGVGAETNVNMPIITNPEIGSEASGMGKFYSRIVRSSAASVTSSVYDAETNSTTVTVGTYNTGSAHILTDTSNNFVAVKPGKTYKMTFKAKSETGTARVQLGVGVPKTTFQAFYTQYQWYRKENNDNGYSDLTYKSEYVIIDAIDDYAEYTAVVTVPEDYPEDQYNFAGLRITDISGKKTISIKDVVVEEYILKTYVHVGETVTETVVAPDSVFVPEIVPEAPTGMEFKGWFLDAEFTQAMPEEGVVVSQDTHIYAKFGYPVSVVYNYLNADGSAATKAVTEGVVVGENYALDFLAPNTADKYFVDWYLTEDFSGEPIGSIIAISEDDQYNIYAKYVEYAASAELHLPGDGATTDIHLPIISNPDYGTKKATYYRITRASTTWITSSTYDAETNTTRFIANDNSATTAHVLVDANNSFVAAKPGATYKATFKAKSESGVAKVQLGVGVPNSVFYRTTWGTTDWYNGYHEMVYKSDAVEITATEDFAEYTAMVTVPEEFGEDVVNFIGLRFVNVGEIKYIDVKDIVVEEYIPEPITVVYNYKNADGTAAQKVVDEDLEIGDSHAIGFLAPNTDTQYFVGWYLTPDFSGDAISTKAITITTDGATNLYAKYVDYSEVMNLIVPGDGSKKESAKMPVITDPNGVDKVKDYAINPYIASVFRGASIYDAETGVTEIKGNSDHNNYAIAYILTDKDGNFYAAKPGKNYKVTFEAMGGTGSTNAQFGVGAPANAFEKAWGEVQWNRRENNSSGYRSLLYLSNATTAFNAESFTTYTLTVSVPEDYPADAYNFFGIKFNNTGNNDTTYLIKNIVVEEYVAKAYVHIGDEVYEEEIALGGTLLPEVVPEAPTGMTFRGWYLDANFTEKMPEEGVAVNGDVHLYAKFAYPLSVAYNYLNADGTPATEIITEGISIGSKYTIDFVAPNTSEKYFVDWYLTEDFSGEPVNGKISISADERYNIYAKYVDYATSMNLHIAGSGSTATNVHLPVITNNAYGAQIAEYARIVRASTTWITSSTYDAETNSTRFIANSNNATTAHILVDANDSFVAAKPGYSYKVTFKAKSETGEAKVQLGVGVPNRVFFLTTWGSTDWYDGYHDMVYKSNQVSVAATEDYATYTAVVTVPEDMDEDVVNFIGLRLITVGAENYIDIKDIVVEESITSLYVHIGDEVKELIVAPDTLFIPETPAAPEGKVFAGWFLDESFTQAMPTEGVLVAGEIHLYAKFDYKLKDFYVTSGGASVLKAEEEAAINAQALRVYFDYESDQDGKITVGGDTLKVVKRGVLLAPAAKLQDQAALVKENVGNFGIKVSEKSNNLTDCWANENGVLTYSTYIKNFKVDDDREIVVRGYIELEDGRIFYSEVCTYSVIGVKEAN